MIINRSFLVITITIFVVFTSSSNSFGQLKTVQFDQLDSLQTKSPRHVVVFIHTDWCKFCHKMTHTTLKDDSVMSVLNKNFYFIRLNAEFKEDIHYGGHTFKYKPNGHNTGVHELAEQLGTIDGKMTFPTISIINKKNEIVFQYGSFMKKRAMLTVLNTLE